MSAPGPAPITEEEFAAWARRLGLGGLSGADLRELHRGWLGLQPQLGRLREGLAPQDAPPLPPLGIPG
jgi:hypothetical protein